MRAGVWWSAVALALLAVTSALRTTQVEGASRTGRRLPAPTIPNIRNSSEADSLDSVSSTFRPRSSRRRDESLRDMKIRSDTRRPLQGSEINLETSQSHPKAEQNERYDSRRITSRTRSRTTENAATTEAPSARKDSVLRSRSRSNVRRTPITSTTQVPFDVSSSVTDESKIETFNLEDVTKTLSKENNAANQFRRRSSTVTNIENTSPKRVRGRIITRPIARSLDLDVSGTTNTFTNVDKEPTTARNSRKLRYKTRLTETDTNLTGEGITTTNEVIKSSQKNGTITSQNENQTNAPILPELPESIQSIQLSTEATPVKSTTAKVQKVVRRPLTRGKTNFKPTTSSTKYLKAKDEISEDDNYPESFKALIQAKNASTQVSSPSSESLTLKASQVYTTYITSPQSSNTGPVINKYSRLRNKLNVQAESNKESKEEYRSTTETLESSKPKKMEFRPRGTYNPRSRKLTSYTPSGASTTISSYAQSSGKSAYKYSRKLKVNTTTTESSKLENLEKTKSVDSHDPLKKPFARPSLYTRKSYNKKSTTTTERTLVLENMKNNTNIGDSTNTKKSIPKLGTLPRTSYYARSRNLKTQIPDTTESPKETIVEVKPLETKNEDTADMPLIFTLLKKPADIDVSTESKETKKNDKDMFIIAVSSTESREQNIVNDMVDTAEESESKLVLNDSPTTVKYHAIYKDPEINNQLENTEYITVSSTPVVRNLKSSRTRTKSYDKDEDIPVSVTTRSRERNSRKYSESFSKMTEASTNGITPEPDKSKSRFSSKFRASYLDKPFYKPTVPTITSSTAWLKFFVTDNELTKTIEEPYWFDGEDFPDVTTELMTRTNTIASPNNHESSIELVEGEEIDLGSDVNAISFTKTQSKLASADLRLSESLVKSSQILNVEASQHSPSVTISIFDALAEILTSTPRTQLPSTTEVPQKQNINNNVLKSLNGVSNNANVNSVQGLASQDTTSTTSADANTNAKPVQNTDQTPNVNNRLPVGESTTQPLNTEDGMITPVNIAQPTLFLAPTPPPTTPISARRPFAIKVLYSEQPTDQTTTASVSTSFQGSTDNPTTVYNTVSDLLLSSNNLVSSELTSMLSNNIKDIIKNMDETSRSRLSSDMNELLKILIPRALDRLATVVGDEDIIPNTTPYTLEEIKDTENIDIANNTVQSGINIFPNVVSRDNVNNTTSTATIFTVTAASPTAAVNSSETTQRSISTLSVSSSQTTPTDFDLVINLNTSPTAMPATSQSLASSDLPVTDGLNTETSDISGISASDTNEPDPRPLFTNFRFFDKSTREFSQVKPTRASKQIVYDGVPSQIITTQRNENISPLQLWVLSKKARVLKMIEDIINQHNNEIATVTPVTDILQSNNIPLSNRLTKIINTMTSTTSATDSTSNDDITSQTTVPSNVIPNSVLSMPIPNETSSTTSIDNPLTTIDPSASSQIVATETAAYQMLNGTEATSETTVAILSRNLDGPIRTTVQENTETTTDPMEIDTTTQLNTDTTPNSDTTTRDTNAELTATPTIQTRQNLVSSTQATSVSTTIPKKDYVIFGILPNNTVVRKNPNDDVLESLTEASPYIIYGVLPNNTVIRKFPNGTRVPRIMQKIDVLPISPWSLRNPYSPIHNNPAIVRPQSNPIRVSTNTVTSTDTANNGTDRLTTDTISSSALNIKGSSSLGITTATNKPPADKITASHVLSLRTTTMLPSVDEILLNSISTAAKEEMVISSMTSSTGEPRILTLDIDPETKEIRTEKPGDGTGNAVFKFIPIDEVTVAPQNTNVLKLATKTAMSTETQTTLATETNTQTAQIQTSVTGAPTTTIQGTTGSPITMPMSETIPPTITTTINMFTPAITTTAQTTTMQSTTSTPVPTTTLASTTQTAAITTSAPTMTTTLPPTTIPFSTSTAEEEKKYQEDAELLQSLLLGTRDPKSLNTLSTGTLFTDPTTTALPPFIPLIAKQNEEAKLLEALLLATGKNTNPITTPNIGGNLKINGGKTTTSRSIEADLKQLQEDTKLLQALLQATGQNPANFNLPSFDINTTTRAVLPSTTTITTTTGRTTTTPQPTTTTITEPTTIRPTTVRTTTSISADIKKIEEDTKLLQALLQAVGQSPTNFNAPIISGVTSNVRIASNPLTTSVGSNPTTPINLRPVYTSQTTGLPPPFFTLPPRTVPNTLQPVTTTERVRISTTFTPRRTTTVRSIPTTLTARRAPASRVTSTTDIPSSSTFSVQEDLAFLENLKSVLKANPNNEDPEGALANRIIALAVERSLNEIQSGTSSDTRTGKKIANNVNNIIPTTARRTINPVTTTTTPRPTTTTPRPTTTTPRPTTTTLRPRTTVSANTQSLEDDIKQFQEDTKLLQALLQATGQDPSKFKIPTLPNLTGNVKVSPNIKTGVTGDLKVLSNLLASPSPLNEPFDSLTQKDNGQTKTKNDLTKPFGAKIAVKDNLKTIQDDEKLLKTLVKLQDAQETTTQRNKLTLTGQTSDEALKKLLQQPRPTSMVSEATQAPMSLSTEFGKSNDALLAALLKEQGFGPTTASSLDEQLRLSALLNQVVVTPKARRTTTPAPPPPPQRRPILDGLAWLWQQWRETAPGPTSDRPNRRPSSSAKPSIASSAATSNRVNWFGSGPFVGNADEKPSSNRIPLEPPAAVTSNQTPGRGQLVSAAINVTRAFSQFLGAAIQGAAQTVQNVIRAGQRVATDVYVNGSGGSG